MSGDSDTEQQLYELQEDLRRVKEERREALQELEEFKWRLFSTRSSPMDMLEAEAERAKESERRMLESLTCQTKQLEQTKMLLEEARLENRSLRDSVKIFESSVGRGSKNFAESMTADAVHDQEEIGMLRNELKLALEAEEKSKKAMDDLALALKEVTTESKCAKENLSRTRAEHEITKKEMERLKSTLKHTEGKLRVASDHCRRLKLEAEESSATWNEKENSFVKCIKMCEDEITNMKRENSRLIDSQRAAKEDTSKLRDILKQAVNEATVVKEALEIARKENSQLKDLMSEKDNELQDMKQELECLQVSEAAALDTVKELQSLLVATSSMEIGLASNSSKRGSARNPANGAQVRKTFAKFPSANWKDGDRCAQMGLSRSLNDSQRFGSIFDMVESPPAREEEALAVAVASKKNDKTKSFDEFDSFAESHADGAWDSPTRRKKRQILRRFGELLLRRAFHK